MIFPNARPSLREQQRHTVREAVKRLSRKCREFFWPGERYAVLFDSDGLGVLVFVDSVRPETLLHLINGTAFSSFAFLGLRFNGRHYSTHFRGL